MNHNQRMQAKEIPDLPVLPFLAGLGDPATLFIGFERSVANAMPDGVNEKLALAKMRSLKKRGLVDGFVCGCRGGFVITAAGVVASG